jgi:cytochrome c55X
MPRTLGSVLALGLILVPAPVAADEPPVARQQELLYRLRQDCGSCHGLTLKGGLGPALLPSALAGKSAEALAEVMLNGVRGTPMPPWGFEIAAGEALWLARRLMQGIGDEGLGDAP